MDGPVGVVLCLRARVGETLKSPETFTLPAGDIRDASRGETCSDDSDLDSTSSIFGGESVSDGSNMRFLFLSLLLGKRLPHLRLLLTMEGEISFDEDDECSASVFALGVDKFDSEPCGSIGKGDVGRLFS